jgi:hypothetical protein
MTGQAKMPSSSKKCLRVSKTESHGQQRLFCGNSELLLLFYPVVVPFDHSQQAKSATADGLTNVFRLNWQKSAENLNLYTLCPLAPLSLSQFSLLGMLFSIKRGLDIKGKFWVVLWISRFLKKHHGQQHKRSARAILFKEIHVCDISN